MSSKTPTSKGTRKTPMNNPRVAKRARFNNSQLNPLMNTKPKRRSIRLIRKKSAPSAPSLRQQRLIQMVITPPGNTGNPSIAPPTTAPPTIAPIASAPPIAQSASAAPIASAPPIAQSASALTVVLPKDDRKMEVDKTPPPSPSPSFSPPFRFDPNHDANCNNANIISENVPRPPPNYVQSRSIRSGLTVPPGLSNPSQPILPPVNAPTPFNQAEMVRLLRQSQSVNASNLPNTDAVFMHSFNEPTPTQFGGLVNQQPHVHLPVNPFGPPPPTFQPPPIDPTSADDTSILNRLVQLLERPSTTATRARQADPLGIFVSKMVAKSDQKGFLKQRYQISNNAAYTATKNMAPEQRERMSRNTPSDVSLISQAYSKMKYDHLDSINDLMQAELQQIIGATHNRNLPCEVLIKFLHNVSSFVNLLLFSYKDHDHFGGMTADLVTFTKLNDIDYVWSNIFAILSAEPHTPLSTALVSAGFHNLIPRTVVAARVKTSGMKKNAASTKKPKCPNLNRWPRCTNKSVAHRAKYFHPTSKSQSQSQKPVVAVVGPPAPSDDSI